jgi:proton-dependent oligopeptide transporter, POT family
MAPTPLDAPNELLTAPDPAERGWPRGIPYIIGNEGCERFSFYGMKAILFTYLTAVLSQGGLASEAAEREATTLVHTFNAGVYALPMVGALVADRLLGKYRTILWLSLAYCAGHACLAAFEGDLQGFGLGLVLICVGAGGIKPCVSAHVGDQFGRGNFAKLERVYQLFYFTINCGSVLATLLIPWLRTHYGYGVAFGLPGVLMALATLSFWAGRRVFVHVPAEPGGMLGAVDALSGTLLFAALALPMFGAGVLQSYAALDARWRVLVSLGCLAAGYGVFRWRQAREPDAGVLAVLQHCVVARFGQRGAAHEPPLDPAALALPAFFRPAARRFGVEAAEGPAAVMRISTVFALVSVFWALFDQHASSWIAQARQMDRSFALFGARFELMPEQIQAANPALVMLLVPFTGAVLYPALGKLGLTMTPLRRMATGMFVAALAFVIVALAQARLDAGERVHVSVQLGAFAVLTLAEVMVSVTGLEFAYSQAPKRMKSLLMGLWLLTVSFGNLLVAAFARLEHMPRVQFFWTFAGLMAVAACVFALRAALYEYRSYAQ